MVKEVQIPKTNIKKSSNDKEQSLKDVKYQERFLKKPKGKKTMLKGAQTTKRRWNDEKQSLEEPK